MEDTFDPRVLELPADIVSDIGQVPAGNQKGKKPRRVEPSSKQKAFDFNQCNQTNTVMPRGGKREGSGRKQGAVAKIDQEARDKAVSMGVKPLDIMLAMIKAEIDCGRPDRDSGSPDREFLLKLLTAAAPYVHAKMNENKVSGALEIIHVPHVKNL